MYIGRACHLDRSQIALVTEYRFQTVLYQKVKFSRKIDSAFDLAVFPHRASLVWVVCDARLEDLGASRRGGSSLAPRRGVSRLGGN